MKGLEQAMQEEFETQARDMGVSVQVYKAMWRSTFDFISGACEPSHRLVKDSLRLVSNFAKMVGLCRLHEREDYTEQVMQAKISTDSEGLKSTEIGVVSREAKEPPLLPSLFHPFKMAGASLRRIFMLPAGALEYLSDYPRHSAPQASRGDLVLHL